MTETPTHTPTATATATETGAPEAEPGTATPTATLTATLPPLGAQKNRAPAATVRISEIMPAPAAVDWNGDGKAGPNDEWIELYNASNKAVDITGWSLDLGPKATAKPYRFGRRTVLQPGRFLVIYQHQSKLMMDDKAGQVRLIDAGGKVVDSVKYTDAQHDRSFSRVSEDVWSTDLQPSPGQANVPSGQKRNSATPTPSATATP